VQVVGDVVYLSIPGHVDYFKIASLKSVVVQNKQSFPCNLQGIKCMK